MLVCVGNHSFKWEKYVFYNKKLHEYSTLNSIIFFIMWKHLFSVEGYQMGNQSIYLFQTESKIGLNTCRFKKASTWHR